MDLSRERALFETCLAPVLPPAYGLAYYLLQQHEAAETLVQVAALRAFPAFCLYQPDRNFTVWFLKVQLTVYREMRQEDSSSPPASEEKVSTPRLTAAPEDDDSVAPLAALTEAQIAGAFTQLAPDVRLIVALYFLTELSYRQIAEILGLPVHEVRLLLHRGRWTLHRLLCVPVRAASLLPAGPQPAATV